MIALVADVHLQGEGARCASFFAWLERMSSAQAIYLLGDILDICLGDDDPNPMLGKLSRALRALADSGVAIYYQHGNRDFLLGADFARSSGCQLIGDEHLIEYQNKRILLMHGDSLCTADVDYQRLRQQLRNPEWQRQFCSQPLELRQAQAAQIAAQSTGAKSAKDSTLMDVDQQAVVHVLQNHRADLLIHGHTHLPAQHRLDIGGRSVERWVLGYWPASGEEGLSFQL